MLKNAADLKRRTKDFALRIVRLSVALPKKQEAQLIGKQLFRSGTSVGAQFCEALRAKSDADLVSKLESCLQELEETKYWIELLQEAKIIEPRRLRLLHQETDELIAIFVSLVRKIKRK